MVARKNVFFFSSFSIFQIFMVSFPSFIFHSYSTFSMSHFDINLSFTFFCLSFQFPGSLFIINYTLSNVLYPLSKMHFHYPISTIHYHLSIIIKHHPLLYHVTFNLYLQWYVFLLPSFLTIKKRSLLVIYIFIAMIIYFFFYIGHMRISI